MGKRCWLSPSEACPLYPENQSISRGKTCLVALLTLGGCSWRNADGNRGRMTAHPIVSDPEMQKPAFRSFA